MKAYITFKGERADYFLSELEKYVTKITNGEMTVTSGYSKTFVNNALMLGLLNDFNLDTSDLKEPFIEDIIDINVKNGTGYIAGSNERSVLMGIYKYFTFAGCRFLRPGDDGEYIPYCDLSNFNCTYRKKADMNFRGQCTEGAASYEHYRDVVYWMPKVGYNMFMIEGFVPYTYMHKWYGHVGNTVLREKGQVTDYGFLEEKIALLEKDIYKTGMQFHSLGHNWMFQKFGAVGSSNELPEDSYQYLPLINGKREVKKDLFYTQLCYSNPEVRRRLAEFVVEYVQQKPHVDYLHLWLADSTNNDCECENCVKMHPSDWYVVLLNDIDAALTKIGSNTRIVFIQYVETVRPPEKMRLNNPKRFTLLTAIGINHTEGYVKEKYDGEIPTYTRNNYKGFPSRLSLQWTDEWKAMHGNIPSIVFEYRYYIDHTNDPGYMAVSKETHRDMKRLKTMDFDGNMSDQSPRLFFPTSLPMLIEAATLFDLSVDFESFANDYFNTAFGKDGPKCREYLEKITELFSPHLLRRGGWVPVEDAGTVSIDNMVDHWQGNPEFIQKLSQVQDTVDGFLPVIKKNTELNNECQALSWKYLVYHADMIKSLAQVFITASSGDIEKAQQMFDSLMDDISKIELDIHRVFDFFLFFRNFRAKLKMPSIPYFD